jgi:thioredoxin-related protein
MAIVIRGIVAAAGLVAVSALLHAEELRDPEIHFFEQSFGDMAEELQSALDEGKTGMLVMFEAEDCPWCRRMKETVLNRASVQNYFRDHFRIVTVDTEGDGEVVSFNGEETVEKDFALKYNRVRATPTFVFFGAGGEVLARYTGTTKNAEEFLWLGQFVVEGRYRDRRFMEYKRQRQEQQG